MSEPNEIIDTSPKISRKLIFECNHTQTTMSKYKLSEVAHFINKIAYCVDCKCSKTIVSVS